MWLDQVSLSSMKTPRYLTQVVRVMVLSLIFTLKSYFYDLQSCNFYDLQLVIFTTYNYV